MVAVVINPSGSGGHSFKGLHAYCAHDQGSGATAERVDWTETRNLGTDDPAQAWKVMAATAKSQNELKRAAGIRAGRHAKEGAVMHVVIAFDKDEPRDRDTMIGAADELLSHLGVDPKKMRGKSKPKRKQFADEHQVVMYAHNDTENPHIHLMVNTVHPEHGVKLPSSNDQLKAQKWALKFSKRHGTDHKTPAREENAKMREDGEYVKGQRRKSRNVYEQEKALAQPANDNGQKEAVQSAQRKKDAALALRGRSMATMHKRALETLIGNHEERKAALGRALKKETNKLKAQIREEYRPKWRDLKKRQQAERRTFDSLETSFFGKASNMAKALKATVRDVQDGSTGFITRTFKVLTNAGERKAYLERAQQRQRATLGREQAERLKSGAEALTATHSKRMAAVRSNLMQERGQLLKRQEIERARLKEQWKERNAERKAAYKGVSATAAKAAHKAAPARGMREDRIKSLSEQFRIDQKIKARVQKTSEQNNDKGKGRGR